MNVLTADNGTAMLRALVLLHVHDNDDGNALILLPLIFLFKRGVIPQRGT